MMEDIIPQQDVVVVAPAVGSNLLHTTYMQARVPQHGNEKTPDVLHSQWPGRCWQPTVVKPTRRGVGRPRRSSSSSTSLALLSVLLIIITITVISLPCYHSVLLILVQNMQGL
eukprot:7269226-Pyramimonas_sp.AAC.1